MYKHLLIATDGSELAQKALEQGLQLARSLDATVTVVTVTEPWHAYTAGEPAVAFPIDEYEAIVERSALDLLAKAQEQAGAGCETVHVRNAYPGEGILETAQKSSCDLIVMASHGRRGLSRLLLGSQANYVITHSELPVLVCR